MRILICDDNLNDCEFIKHNIISNLTDDFEGAIFCLHNANECISFTHHNNPDILFLDIELGDSNGIQLAKYLKSKFPYLIIIYISNHPRYVFSCFETEPLDFLRKPINKIELDRTFSRAISKYKDIHKMLPIKWQNEAVNLEIKDICYIEGYNRHLIFKLYNGDCYEVVGKINDVYETLKLHGFIKSHQGYIVNMLHIKDFDENVINMKNGETVLMSVRRRLKTKEAYFEYINRR